MGSFIDFKNFNDTSQHEINGGKPMGTSPLVRQSSIYSLTFDEFQTTIGGAGKDFGSMNMDELLKNIWTAEETQALVSASGTAGGNIPAGNLQRQGSLTLPRTLSQKTVDEVWRDLFNLSGGGKDGNASGGGSSVPQRQPTLGEMTLEEFLMRAGVVKEDPQPIGMQNNGGLYGDFHRTSNNNTGFTFGLQQSAQNNGVLANQATQCNSFVPNQSSNLVLNMGGVISSQPQLQQQQQQPQPQPRQQLLFPNQTTLAFSSPTQLIKNTPLPSPRTKGGAVGVLEFPMKNSLVQGGIIQSGGMGMAGLSGSPTTIAATSPANQLSSDNNSQSNNTSSLSPRPYMFSEGVRGRKSSGSLEKVQERRHRRMIKNRESAARSRARKQAYTLELEAELAKLKEINEELQKKQEEILKMQNNQIVEKMKMPWGSKRQCLRRTLTGPW